MAPAPQRRSLALGAARLAWLEAGEGPPLVLLHGLAGSARWWQRNIGPLSQHRRVYAVDLFGFGDSRCAAPVSLEHMANLLADWMERVGIARAAVAGHSLGGCVAAHLAADAPQRVDRLVLVDAPAVPFRYSRLRHLRSALHSLRHLPPDFAPTFLSDLRRCGPRTVRRLGQELLAADLRPRLGAIQAPTLVVWGACDWLVPLAYGRQVAALVPGAHFIVLPGCGHVAMWERAETFNALLLDFLAESAAPALAGPGAAVAALAPPPSASAPPTVAAGAT